MTKISWTQLKQLIDNNNLFFSWMQDDNSYSVSSFNGPLELFTLIPTTNPPSADQLDFESNYKANGNQSLKLAVVQKLGADSVSICPFGTMFEAPKNAVTTFDLSIADTIYLKGGIMYSDPGNVGDTLTVQVVDKDNITGLGADTVLATYVNNWYVIPKDMNSVEDISLSQPMMAGLYVRFIYTNSSILVDCKVIVNLLAYQGIS